MHYFRSKPDRSAPDLPRYVPCGTEGEQRAGRRVAVNSVLLTGLDVHRYAPIVFFGITLPAVRIAGGLVLIAFGWKLLHNGAELEDKRSSEAGSHSTAIGSFYPLTMPLTVGPGSISVAIALGSQWPEGPLTLSELALLGGSAIAGIIALSLTVYVCYRFAKRTIALLGGNGINVVIRLSAFILLCIGIQILWTGYSTLVIAPRA